MTTTTISSKGEIVIPKKIREAIGLQPHRTVHLLVRGKKLEISATNDNIMEEWAAFAKKHGEDLSKIDIDKIIDEELYRVP